MKSWFSSSLLNSGNFESKEELQTMIRQNLGGVKEVYYVICASRELVVDRRKKG